MITAKELRTWLDTLPKEAEVYVSDESSCVGGLTLKVVDSEAYLEIGG